MSWTYSSKTAYKNAYHGLVSLQCKHKKEISIEFSYGFLTYLKKVFCYKF